MARTRRGRKFWTKLIEDFEEGGGRERHEAFANRHGVHCDTFRRWLYLLRSERQGDRRRSTSISAPAAAIGFPLVEVQPSISSMSRFEIELRDGTRVRVPAKFEAEVLQRLLTILAVSPSP